MLREPFTPTFFRRLQQLKIHTRRAFLGSRQGIHLSLRRGHGLEFSDYRVYAPGDDFRHIDWGVYGRTDRLYVRQFREEQDLNILILLDASASMALPERSGKFDLARNLALALGYIAMSDGDSVCFSVLGQKNTPKYKGHRAINRAIAELQSITPQGSFDIVHEIRAAVAKQRIPGRCFLISDFLFDLTTAFSAIDLLRGRNFDISLIQVLAPQELTLDRSLSSPLVVDSETGELVEIALGKGSSQEYAELLARHIASIESYCKKAGIIHALVSSAESLNDIVLTKFPAAGLVN